MTNLALLFPARIPERTQHAPYFIVIRRANFKGAAAAPAVVSPCAICAAQSAARRNFLAGFLLLLPVGMGR